DEQPRPPHRKSRAGEGVGRSSQSESGYEEGPRYPFYWRKRKPPRAMPRGFCTGLSVDTNWRSTAGGFAVHDLAEAFPGVALELHQLKLRERGKVGRRGVDLDARQKAAELEVLEACRLLHDVGAGEVVTALLEHLHQALSDRVAEDHRGVGAVGFRIILVQELVPRLHARVVLPLRVGRILQVGRGDDVLAVLESGGLHHAAD